MVSTLAAATVSGCQPTAKPPSPPRALFQPSAIRAQAFGQGASATNTNADGRHSSTARRSPPALNSIRARFEALDVPLAYAEAARSESLLALLSELESLNLPRQYHSDWFLLRGRIQLVLGNAQEALEEMQAALRAGNRKAAVYGGLAIALLATGDKLSALPHFQQAARLAPRVAEYRANLGTALMMHSRPREAIAEYSIALELEPGNAKTHSDLGTAWLALLQPRRALPHLRQALQLSPQKATFLTNLGYAYQLLGNLGQAEETQRRAIEQDSQLASAWLNLGSVLALQLRFDEAEQALRVALQLAPDDPRPATHLKDLAQMRGSASGVPPAKAPISTD